MKFFNKSARADQSVGAVNVAGMIVIYAMAIIIRISARPTHIPADAHQHRNEAKYESSICTHNQQKIQFSFFFIQNSNNSQSERISALSAFTAAAALPFPLITIYFPFVLLLLLFVYFIFIYIFQACYLHTVICKYIFSYVLANICMQFIALAYLGAK